MRKLRIYLDSCCYNRPYDDQSQAKVVLETLAKLYIQELVLNKKLDLVWSYILKFENSQNSFEAKREAIAQWEKLSVRFVGKSDEVVTLAKGVEATGVKPPDALHIACAITAKCDYFISVDNRVLKYRDDRITVCSPVDFVQKEAGNDK
ncbi:MAG: PIN domain-containing protein [Treponematales bacterium]